MQALPLERAFTWLESGPVTWITTRDARRANLMTITWTMVRDFDGGFAITTGPWNYSWQALSAQRECVIAIPGADLLDTVIGVGMTSGRDTDKFAQFGLTAVPASKVGAPLVAEALANIECRVEDILEPYGIVILQAVALWGDAARGERRVLHAVGDGTFIADGERFDRRKAMAAKLPFGI